MERLIHPRRRVAMFLAATGAITLTLAACGSTNNSTTSGSPGGGGSTAGKIALLLPETKTTRYEAADKPYFLQQLQSLGYDTSQVIYSNANQDAALQQNQADAAITNGAKVLVLDPVDSASAASIANKAHTAGIPVVSYDRLITGSSGVNYYISFDNQQVGKLQAQALVDALTAAGKTAPHIVMINGSPTDNNAHLFKAGAHSVFDPLVSQGKLFIDKEYDTPDWSPDQAQNEMQQALTALSNKVDGVYCANDGTAGGAIAAMKAAGVTPLPPVTGQDAELAGIQRVIAGDQYMTVYKAIKPEAAGAATMAFDLASGKSVPSNLASAKVNNGATDVPSQLLTPVAVTKSNVKDTVVKDGFHTAAEICTAAYAQFCTQLGIS
jgi:D-xylose transport system substrate-binding protein